MGINSQFTMKMKGEKINEKPWIDLLRDDDVDLEQVAQARLVCPSDRVSISFVSK